VGWPGDLIAIYNAVWNLEYIFPTEINTLPRKSENRPGTHGTLGGGMSECHMNGKC
jgi:hypothetical protein